VPLPRARATAFALGVAALGGEAGATVIFNNVGLAEGSRWDAAPRSVPILGERSLDGGLRYSVQGGSYAAYRDLFTWAIQPEVDAFQAAVEAAFTAWESIDPVTGLGTSLFFTPDLGRPVVGPGGSLPFNARGAEIDLLAYADGFFWDEGDPGLRAEAFFLSSSPTTVTLTSGTTGYAGRAIDGADIKLNSNPEALWTLDWFQIILTHEIGHALGFGDVDFPPTSLSFIDDDFDGSSSAAAFATLTNSWALLVDPYDPSASPLALYAVADGDPGFDTFGVNILMESHIHPDFLGLDPPLQNDDYGGRQFLYPFVPEPGTVLLLAFAAGTFVQSSRLGARALRRSGG
jgi:hypothetical protein